MACVKLIGNKTNNGLYTWDLFLHAIRKLNCLKNKRANTSYNILLNIDQSLLCTAYKF